MNRVLKHAKLLFWNKVRTPISNGIYNLTKKTKVPCSCDDKCIEAIEFSTVNYVDGGKRSLRRKNIGITVSKTTPHYIDRDSKDRWGRVHNRSHCNNGSLAIITPKQAAKLWVNLTVHLAWCATHPRAK